MVRLTSMELNQRIKGISKLGAFLGEMDLEALNEISHKAFVKNPWFTHEHIKTSLGGIKKFLESDMLEKWAAPYSLTPRLPRKVGLIMAGNLPMVGFHDLLCVLISGHKAIIKLSSKDDVLIPWSLEKLLEFEPYFSDQVSIVEKLKEVEAVIATGSDNSARYFEYYFRHIPRIVRMNRTSMAILNGSESEESLKLLGKDILLYFGLGCRNVSKIFIPRGYDLVHLLDQFQNYHSIIDHNKYKNNYDYNRAIYLVNKQTHLDTGFLLFKEDTGLFSPTAVVYYEFYESIEQLTLKIEAQRDKIQCVISELDFLPDRVPFGLSQFPEVDDYADGVDTLSFLDSLK